MHPLLPLLLLLLLVATFLPVSKRSIRELGQEDGMSLLLQTFLPLDLLPLSPLLSCLPLIDVRFSLQGRRKVVVAGGQVVVGGGVGCRLSQKGEIS